MDRQRLWNRLVGGWMPRGAALLRLATVAGAVLLATGATADGKQKKRPKPPACSTVAPLGTIDQSVQESTGTAPDLTAAPVGKTKFSLWADGAGGLRGRDIPSTYCAYNWVYPGGGTPPGDPDPNASSLNLSDPLAVYVGSGVTESEWKNIRVSQASEPGTRTDECHGACDYQPLQSVHIGGQAFVLPYNETAGSDYPSSAPWAEGYELYILTKHHNILQIDGWPMSLASEEALANRILSKYAAL
jgi:hypothetical protein